MEKIISEKLSPMMMSYQKSSNEINVHNTPKNDP